MERIIPAAQRDRCREAYLGNHMSLRSNPRLDPEIVSRRPGRLEHISKSLKYVLILFPYISLIYCYQPYADDGIDLSIAGDLRNYYFQRDFKTGPVDKESFAIGGILRFLLDYQTNLKFGLAVYTSQGAGLNDSEKDVYNLLASDAAGDHENYTALGEAYIDLHYNPLAIKLGRLALDTPWLNQHDVRMTPQSFDAAILQWSFRENAQINLCHVARMKYKTDTHAISMSETAGFGGDEGVSCLGFEKTGEIGLQLWSYRAHDMWDDVYLRVDIVPDGGNMFLNSRYLRRSSSGDRLAGTQDTWHAGVSGGISLGTIDLVLAYSQNGQRDILRKWGHAITISNQVMVADRSREKAWLAGFEYSPSSYPEFQIGFSIADHDTPDSGAEASPDRKEYNVDFNYSFAKLAPGLSFRARYAKVNEIGTGAEDLDDIRFYLRYLFKYQ